jgi:glycerol-3-phosphate dehydrogenase
MASIDRNIKKYSLQPYDLIIVGGGITGVMLLLEATRKQLRPLMIEERDFGSQTTLNHLRTLHGGLRYLQTLDIRRFRESIAERKWFMRYFPTLVRPMPCLMPLYRKGLKRRSILRMAVLINDLLSMTRNQGVRCDKQLPRSRTVSAGEVRDIFPRVNPDGLEGGAVWYDASMEEHQRLVMEILKLAVVNGAVAQNYVKATGLSLENGVIKGIKASDLVSGREHRLIAPVVVNAAGPWNRELSALLDRDYPRLFPKRLLNWNVLFDAGALSRYSLGLTPIHEHPHTYFFHNWKNRLLVGTGEFLVERTGTELSVPEEAMKKFLDDINSVVPGLNLTKKNILRVYPGILPAKPGGTLAKREIILDHGLTGGPAGLFSVSGVKFTTARLVAKKSLDLIYPNQKSIPYEQIFREHEPENAFFEYEQNILEDSGLRVLENIRKQESVVHLSDLLLRRTSIGDHPSRAFRVLGQLKKLFPGTVARWESETTRLRQEMENLNILNTGQK